jgi:hypothetical protein
VTTFGHVIRLFHECVDGVVHSLDAVGVVDRKLRIIRRLNLFVDDTVDYTESVHLQLHSFDSPVLDALVLLVEVVVESGPIMATITLQKLDADQLEIPNALTSQSTS